MLAVRELIVLCYRKEHKRFAKNTKIEHSNTNLRVNKIEILCNQFIKIGTIAMGIGICLGAIWAKKAWGQYWSWDIKETAALITWFIFLLYLHLQKLTKINRKYLLIIVIIGFMSLLFTWFGVNYLPSAQKSPHTFYTAQNSTVYSTKQELSLLFEREKL
jgi:cytochrome c biogenesis factor